MKLRTYEAAAHREACLRLFDGNVGVTFQAGERAAYAAFLDDLPGPYFVWCQGDDVAACGGIAFEDRARTLASVCWTIVDRERQGAGFGRLLVETCIDEARGVPTCTAVRLETIPQTAGFFTRLGFDVVRTDRDAYGPGQDRVEMRLEAGS